MVDILSFISFLWLIRTLKAVLFWVYIWQLKEYHIGRFIDHFRTKKGKKILLNYLLLFKFFLFVLIFFNFNIAAYLLVATYIAEVILFIGRGYKGPVFTFKAMVLSFVCFTVVILFWLFSYKLGNSNFIISLISFDILAPVIFTAIILLFEPIAVAMRSNTIERATQKMLKHKDLKVIAITGSYGKTTTKEFLATILSSKFNVLHTKDHKNSEMGVSQTILNDLDEKHEVFIVEMGAYVKGGIKLLCDMVKPEIGMVTGVNEQHLATFGSMENLLSAEGGYELLESLKKEGLLVVNGDNKYCVDLYKKAHINKKIYSVNNDKVDSDVFAKEITVEEHSLDFMVMTKEKETAHVNMHVLGKQNIQNLLGAILIAMELGMSLEEVSKASKNIKEVQAGITFKKGIHSLNIIDSSYSSNPDGVIADLDYLNIFKGKKIVVMPCLIELGDKATDIHIKIGKKISEVCDMAIITTRDKFKELKDEAVKNGMNADKVIFCENASEIFQLVTTSFRNNDTVLLEGRVPKDLLRLLIGK